MDNWILLKDKEPEYGHMVLACTNNGVIHMVVVGDKLWQEYTRDSDYYGATGFTHWMPLPKRPDIYERH